VGQDSISLNTLVRRTQGFFAIGQKNLSAPNISVHKRQVVFWGMLLPFMAAHAQMTIPGSAAVSPSGAANYQIPLQLPPGISGMEPKLALSYNSQSGNGL